MGGQSTETKALLTETLESACNIKAVTTLSHVFRKVQCRRGSKTTQTELLEMTTLMSEIKTSCTGLTEYEVSQKKKKKKTVNFKTQQ